MTYILENTVYFSDWIFNLYIALLTLRLVNVSQQYLRWMCDGVTHVKTLSMLVRAAGVTWTLMMINDWLMRSWKCFISLDFFYVIYYLQKNLIVTEWLSDAADLNPAWENVSICNHNVYMVVFKGEMCDFCHLDACLIICIHSSHPKQGFPPVIFTNVQDSDIKRPNSVHLTDDAYYIQANRYTQNMNATCWILC